MSNGEGENTLGRVACPQGGTGVQNKERNDFLTWILDIECWIFKQTMPNRAVYMNKENKG